MRPDDFEVLPAGEMRRKYGLTAENRPSIKLDPSRIPAELHPLIPFAEQFGVSDDLIREDIVAKTSAADLKDFKAAFSRFQAPLLAWLGGPEAVQKPHSAEYIAFSAMLMAFDTI